MSKLYIGPSRYRLKPVALVGTFDHAIDNLYHVFLTQLNITMHSGNTLPTHNLSTS